MRYLFLLRTWLSRWLPICLVCMPMCIFGTSVYRLRLFMKYFSFILMHLFFDCIVYEVFFSDFGASVFKLQLFIDLNVNVFLINYPGLTKNSTEKDGGVNHASKKDILRGRHSFLLSYLAG
jgi:hypothetical protein